MSQIPISNQNPYKNNINYNNNYIIPKNNISHGKSSSYSGIPNKKQIIINAIQNNQYNYQNQIPNNYYNTNRDFDTLSNSNKYNVTNNFYGNQIINNNINYYPTSRNSKDLRNINNQVYNNDYLNTISNSNINEYIPYNNNIQVPSYNKVIKIIPPNLNLNQNLILDNYNINNYNNINQVQNSGIKFMKKNNSKEKIPVNVIKNIDVNKDYQENNFNNSNKKINFKNKNFIKIQDDDNDNISYFDISNFKNKMLRMNNVKVINNSNNLKNVEINTNEDNHNNPNNTFNFSNNSNSNSRKSSKVKNKMSSRIPHNNIKKIKNIFPANIPEKTNKKFNTSNSKKTKSKIPINMKRRTIEIQRLQNDEESEMNEQLFNTNAFSDKDKLNAFNDNFNEKNEKVENQTYRIYNNVEFINKDNNIDDESENFKSIKDIKKMSNYKTSTESEESKLKSDIFSHNTTTTNYLNNEEENELNIDLNSIKSHEQKNTNVKNKIIQHSKAKSYMLSKETLSEINNEKEIKEDNININTNNNNKLKENILTHRINLVKIEKIENNLTNKKIQIKNDKKLNRSNSNDTMNVSEVSNDDKIMKINNFSSKIKKNILVNKDNNKDFNETNKITISKNNNININDIIKSNQNNSPKKENKSIQYISKTRKLNKTEKTKEDYTKEKNYFKKCKYKSIAGKDSLGNRKINQDLYLVHINFLNIEGFNLFGVLDGHGENGHKVAIFTRDYIISQLTSFFNKNKTNSLKEIYELLKKGNFALIKNIYQNTDKELNNKNFNSNFSGTTCVIVFQVGKKLICSNVGDSRAILIHSSKKEDKELSSTKIFELSKDQKPELPEEKKRIYKMGGIVDQMLDSKGKRNGPFRVWAGTNNYPGLAMSRCIGDLKGKKCGLISEPEIIEYNLDERSKYMVIASDGVWEFIDNEDVMRMGIDFYLKDNVDEFLDKIVQVAEFWWEKEDIIRDDITAVIVFF